MDMVKFSKDRNFEECLVQALIVDHQFAEQMVEVLDVDYFNAEYLKETTKTIFNYYEKHQAFPSFKLLNTITNSDLTNELLQGQIKSYLTRVKANPLNGDMGYIKDASLDFCKKRVLAIALEKSLDHIDNQDYDSVVHEVQKACMKGSERDVGHIYSRDLNKRMAEVRRKPIPTPYPQVNALLKGGGVSGGELASFCAPTGVGKSHALVDIGSHAVQLGFNVVHYTFELNEIDVGNRYDSNISGIAPELLRANKQILEKVLKEKVAGGLVIKSYPTKSASTLTIKNHLNRLAVRDFRPDLLVVDYGDLMKSLKSYEHKRFEEERIYEDLRGIAGEFNIPIWTATQTNREGLDVEVITLKHIAECFAKAMICDLFVTMNRKKDGPNSTVGNMFLAKSRLGPDGVKFPTLFDTSLSRLDVRPVDSIDTSNVIDHTENLRKKFLEMQRKKSN